MRIVVLAGGLSMERNVSLSSGNKICRALRARGHQAILVDMFMGFEDYDGKLDHRLRERFVLLLEIQLRDVVKVFAGILAVGDGVALAPIRTGVRVDAAGGHLIRANLCRLHELVVDAQRGNAFLMP